MEFNISDLLDDLQDSTVNIHPQKVASASRVKELTMEKIIKQEKAPRRGSRIVGKVILVAAVIMALTTTVLAASGFNISDWIDVFSGHGYDTDVLLGWGSMTWELGDGTLRFYAEDVENTGLTLKCETVDWDGEGELAVSEEFWLEEWDGNAYIRMEFATQREWDDEPTVLTAEKTAVWEINWENIYGQLPSGYYRIGRTVTLHTDSGQTQEMACYAKFRLLVEEMEPYIRKCQTALEALLTSESYHLTETSYPSGENGYSFYTQEVWKHGEDYLGDGKYMEDSDGKQQMVNRRTYMLRGGVGYNLELTGDDVTAWKRIDYLDENNFCLWDAFLAVTDVTVGEIYADGNEIVVLEVTGMESDQYGELKYTFDGQGNLESIVYSYVPTKDCTEEEKRVAQVVQVHDTSADEIEKTIARQDVSRPNSFSWAEDQAAHPDALRDGFVNAQPQTITKWEDAVRIAQADCSLTDDITKACVDQYYNIVSVFFDDGAKMWKIVFSDSQDDYFQAVYLNESGITQMVVKAASSN